MSLAGYEDVNDAERLRHDPAMRWIVGEAGHHAVSGQGLAYLLPSRCSLAMPGVYECLEAERVKYAIRIPTNQVLQNRIGYLLKRPVGRPPNEVRRYYANFTSRRQAGPSRAG